MPNFENRAERGEESLREYLKELAGKLKKSGIEVDEECHIDMKAYGLEARYAAQARKDILDIEKRETKWEKEKGKADKKPLQEKMSNGKKMEMFKTALFNKALGGKFFILRSSLFDDYNNGIDNVIVERGTGAVVGAFDEVVSKDGKAEKAGKVAAHNTKGGAFLKYGIGLKDGQIIKQKNEHIPLFYLALEKEELIQAINNFDASEENLSELEKQLLEKLAGSVKDQIEPISKIGMLKNRVSDIQKFSEALQEAIKSP